MTPEHKLELLRKSLKHMKASLEENLKFAKESVELIDGVERKLVDGILDLFEHYLNHPVFSKTLMED